MRILIAGSGGVGCFFGGHLARAGNDVTFLARGDHLKALQSKGLQVNSVSGDFHVLVQAHDQFKKNVKPFDFVLVCVKAHQTKEVISLIDNEENVLHEKSILLSLQNGLNRHEPLIKAFGKERVAAGLCILGAHIERPGVLRHVAAGKMVVGPLLKKQSKHLQDFVGLAKKAKLDIELSPDILTRQWHKMIWNVGFNGPTALLGLNVGETLKRPEERILIQSLMKEAIEVALAQGVCLDRDLDQKNLAFSEKKLAAVETSMLIDRRNKRKLEWDIFQGLISSEGKRLGIATPANDMVGGLLKAINEAST